MQSLEELSTELAEQWSALARTLGSRKLSASLHPVLARKLSPASLQALPVIRYRTGDVTSFVEGGCPCGRPYRRIERFHGRVDDMLVIRGVNVFPSAIEAALLDDPALGGQYAIVVDRRGTLPNLEVHCELASAEADRPQVLGRIEERLAAALRLRVDVRLAELGALPRQEVGKAKRVFEWQTGDHPIG